MRIPLESWLDTQKISLEAMDCFQESFICFRAGAYKAALLFGYLGFMHVLRDRILASPPSTGVPPGQWQNIQHNLRKAETWDASAFGTIQQKTPAPIFIVTDDLRHQVRFWKDRRNDCAHSKDNKITAAYIEALYAFIEANLNKLVVNGSRNEMMRRIMDHFDVSLTPPNTSLLPLVHDLPNAVLSADLPDFFTELSSSFDSTRNSTEVMLDSINRNKIEFINACLQHGTSALRTVCENLLISDTALLLGFLRVHPDKAILLEGHPEQARQLWHDFLFGDNSSDFPLLASMVRVGLIPDAQREEAFRHLIRKGIEFVPNDIDHLTLEEHGFYVCVEKFLIEAHLFSNFEWANKTKALVIKYLSEHALTVPVAATIYTNYNVENHPWHMAEYLDQFFQSNEGKKQEYIAIANTHEAIGRPAYIPSLKDG
jgi:hypothetical protein